MTDKDPQKSPHIKDKFEFTLIIKDPIMLHNYHMHHFMVSF